MTLFWVIYIAGLILIPLSGKVLDRINGLKLRGFADDNPLRDWFLLLIWPVALPCILGLLLLLGVLSGIRFLAIRVETLFDSVADEIADHIKGESHE